MYKILKADKDTYITDRLIDGVRVMNANVGSAGSLDLFKLYGFTLSGSTPNVELSRLLVHFDLSPLQQLVADGKVDFGDPSFSCTVKLFDVYGGQPTPKNFAINVTPLSQSFDEGLGRDIVTYGDNDICNFLTASQHSVWVQSGAGAGGNAGAIVDRINNVRDFNGNLMKLFSTQQFDTGFEDLEIDMTTAVSATMSGLIQDHGFLVLFDSSSVEVDNKSYFVKRFASRSAYNADKHPQMIVKFDDSIQDDTNDLVFDSPNSIFLYNYVQGSLENLYSGSHQVTGSASLILKLQTEISGGMYSVMAYASQHMLGKLPVSGVYSADISVSSTTPEIVTKLAQSSSIKFTPIWRSIDDTVSFLTGSNIFFYPPKRGSRMIEPKRLIVSVTGLKSEHTTDETTTLRVNLFDNSSPKLFKVKLPIEQPGVVVRDTYYSVRDNSTNQVMIPFDKTNKSTRVSSDSAGMYFKLDFSNLTAGRAYVIDILTSTNSNEQIYRDASPVFRVVDL